MYKAYVEAPGQYVLDQAPGGREGGRAVCNKWQEAPVMCSGLGEHMQAKVPKRRNDAIPLMSGVDHRGYLLR